MIRYLITDCKTAGGEREMLDAISRSRVDYIQVREKDLPARDLAEFTRAVLARAGAARVLVNTRADVAIAAGAHGVHLPSGSPPPPAFRALGPLIIGVSCHSVEEVMAAGGADFGVFGPVFETPGKSPAGLDALRTASAAATIPILAIGGVDEANAPLCLDAGAAGFAAIRLFLR